MNCLLQRVQFADVKVDGQAIARIEKGLLIFVGIEKHDDSAIVKKMTDKLIGYRVFADDDGKMNLSLRDVGGDILLVSQFTLAATTTKGLRPSFASAAPPEISLPLFNEMARHVEAVYKSPELGQFGADMQVSLCNDGPVTFSLAM